MHEQEFQLLATAADGLPDDKTARLRFIFQWDGHIYLAVTSDETKRVLINEAVTPEGLLMALEPVVAALKARVRDPSAW